MPSGGALAISFQGVYLGYHSETGEAFLFCSESVPAYRAVRNTFGKLVEKSFPTESILMVSVWHLHANQLGGIRQRSTEDAGLFLTHLVKAGWVKGLKTSVDRFDIAQFFPSLKP